MNQRLAVFDCDGTLVDGQASICEAMEAAFAEAGLAPPDRHAVRRIVGLSLPQAVRRLVPDCLPETEALAVDAYKRAYRTARDEGRIAEPLFDGIAELIEKLHGAGWLLGVATGKSDRGLSHCLAVHGLTHRFATLQTADRHPSKPHPAMMEAALGETLADPARTVMIGDTAFDMGLAVNSGVRAIGVAWGYHEAAELIAAGAEWVADTPDQLGEYLLK
ncbi:MAG: HAD hydrolase-like protein [Novosphingobium sp.]